MGAYGLRGGVGERLLIFFWLRCLDLRDRIEPAHERTFFCFLLGFRVTEGLLELHGSVDWIGTSGKTRPGDDESVSAFFSFVELEADAGLDLGEDSPDFVSPKKVHFLADRGVEGRIAEAVALSISNGNDPRRFRKSGALEPSLSAVLGRVSCLALVSFDGGEPADIMLEIDPDRLCPGPRTVLAESLLTSDRGLGMICTTSLKPTREFLKFFKGSLIMVSGSGVAGSTVVCWRPGKGCVWCSRFPDGLVGALPPTCIVGPGFNIILKSCEDKAAERL